MRCRMRNALWFRDNRDGLLPSLPLLPFAGKVLFYLKLAVFG